MKNLIFGSSKKFRDLKKQGIAKQQREFVTVTKLIFQTKRKKLQDFCTATERKNVQGIRPFLSLEVIGKIADDVKSNSVT